MSSCPHPEKRAYDNGPAARQHAAALRRTGASPDLQAYRCECGKWHVGHSVTSLMYRIRKARRLGRA